MIAKRKQARRNDAPKTPPWTEGRASLFKSPEDPQAISWDFSGPSDFGDLDFAAPPKEADLGESTAAAVAPAMTFDLGSGNFDWGAGGKEEKKEEAPAKEEKKEDEDFGFGATSGEETGTGGELDFASEPPEMTIKAQKARIAVLEKAASEEDKAAAEAAYSTVLSANSQVPTEMSSPSQSAFGWDFDDEPVPIPEAAEDPAEHFEGKAKDSGTESDTLVKQIDPCKMFQFFTAEQAESASVKPGFNEICKGSLDVLKYADDEGKTKARLVVRDKQTMILRMNAPLYADMILKKQGIKSITFASNNLDDPPALTAFLIKFKDGEVLEDVMKTITATKDLVGKPFK